MFLDYDQKTLDRYLNPRVPVPDYESYFERFAERSARTRATLSAQLNVQYGTSSRERLDVFTAPTNALAPVNVFFHGGYWRGGEKERYSFIADTFVEHGAACILVEYDLTPHVTMDTIIGQCRSALSYIYRNSERWNIDANRIYVSGHSAGGQIIGMLMVAGWHQNFSVPTDLIKGGCGISGIYELEPIRLSYLNSEVLLDEISVSVNSPALLRPASSAPLLAAVGDLEGPEFFRQTQSILEAWGQSTEVTTDVLVNTNHYSAVEQLGDENSLLARRILDQMELI